MKQGEFSDQICEENDQKSNKLMIEQVKKLIYSTDVYYLGSNCISKIGNSVVYKMNIKDRKITKI